MDANMCMPLYCFADGTRIAASTWERASEMRRAGHRNVADYYVAPVKFLSIEGAADQAETIAFYPNDMVPR